MTTIYTGNTASTGFTVTSDTTGDLVLKTGGSGGTTAVTVSGTDQSATFATPIIDPIPVFYAWLTNTTNVTDNTNTKVVFDTVSFDSHNYYSSATGRYTPLIAGYYRFDYRVAVNGTTIIQYIADLYKNGSIVFRGNRLLGISGVTTAGIGQTSSQIVYMNGSTDYVEVYGLVDASSGTAFYGAGGQGSFFQGQLIKRD